MVPDDGRDGRRQGGCEVGIGRDRRRRCAERVGEGWLWRRRQLWSVINVLGHLETRKLGLIVKRLSETLRRRLVGDRKRDLEVRRRSLVLQGVVRRLGEVERDGGERGGGGDGGHV